MEVEVIGSTLEEMKTAAIAQAAAFFGVDPAFAELTLDGVHARPHITEVDGAVVRYKANITVLWAPIQPGGYPSGPEGDELDEDADD